MSTITTTLSRPTTTTSGETDGPNKTIPHYKTSMTHGNNNSIINNKNTSIKNLSTKRADPTSKLLTNVLYKNNSFGSCPKSTMITQDTHNGRCETSLTDSVAVDLRLGQIGFKTYALTTQAELTDPTISLMMSTSASSINDIVGVSGDVPEIINNDDDNDDDDNIITTTGPDEHEVFLVNSNGGIASSSSSGISGGGRRNLRSHTKSSRNSLCYRTYACINRNWYLSYLVPVVAVLSLLLVAYLTRDYAKRLLLWVEVQNPWLVFVIFQVLFVVVSFPVAFGYFVLLITSGYMFGCVKGYLTVILGANMGIAIAHMTIRGFRHRIPMHKLIKNETGRAILRVISGPRAFKVVLFTRLTPIPFGIQNAIFGVSSINARVYHTATLLGLLPAQTINVYLGSTLRSMQEVLNSHGTALTGYISFGVEIICGAALMFWVVQKARKELSETLLSDNNTDGKLIDIDV